MLPIQDTCHPRSDILQGSFNPEIFTASLSQVMDHYRGRPTATHALYTDAESFFRKATYATEGLRMVLTDVLSRLAGENSAPALHRLETAFGGGKTHALIALTHLGFRGRELAALTQGIIDPSLLHAPGEVTVVGIAGDEIPVHKPQGTELIPYTIWGGVGLSGWRRSALPSGGSRRHRAGRSGQEVLRARPGRPQGHHHAG